MKSKNTLKKDIQSHQNNKIIFNEFNKVKKAGKFSTVPSFFNQKTNKFGYNNSYKIDKITDYSVHNVNKNIVTPEGGEKRSFIFINENFEKENTKEKNITNNKKISPENNTVNNNLSMFSSDLEKIELPPKLLQKDGQSNNIKFQNAMNELMEWIDKRDESKEMTLTQNIINTNTNLVEKISNKNNDINDDFDQFFNFDLNF
jgi:hypothetical protein